MKIVSRHFSSGRRTNKVELELKLVCQQSTVNSARQKWLGKQTSKKLRLANQEWEKRKEAAERWRLQCKMVFTISTSLSVMYF